ncbi:MAG: tetratricopeptide repeat protein, partial [Pirellula sp.]|nr:tetratricopeptide repeat protein [Pirellula sp.]
MPGFHRCSLLWMIVCLVPNGLALSSLHGQDSQQQELQQEEQKQLDAVARFATVLEKNPRRGTALDRVYGHHVEFGTLDTFVADLAKRASNSPSQGEHWMILGMIEYQRGNDAQAVDAFTKAEALRTKDALASYYLGQAQIRIGDSSAAIASFERALQRKPQRADELEIFQQLGRIHQRAQRTDEAMKVWKRLEELYPDDARVLEQIAVTLAEESQLAEALPRYEKLAATSKDDYRRTTFAIAAAELVVKQGNKSEGIRRLEVLLADLNPDSWLYRDVRRRIDDCFLRAGDQDGLVSYYQTWLENHPQDIEAMNRLARFLKQSARNPEAATWLNKALTLAPSRTDIRKTYIDLLAEDKRFEDASTQYEELLKASPNNADYLREWGKMVLRNKEMPEPERHKQALAIWTRMLEPNPNDAVMVAQVADSCRQNQMLDEAESLYRRAVGLAPGEAQYREYLGEFLHIQKRPDEAKSVWKEIAEGDRRNSDNLARLAEIFNSFGYGEEACQYIAQAIALSPKDFAMVLKGAEYHNKAARFDEASKLVDQAEKLAANDEEQESVLNTRIEVLQSSQQLDTLADVMEEELIAKPDANAKDWYRLAKYREAQRKWDAAASAINKAIEKEPQSILVLTAAARIAESAGDFGRASDLFRKLTQVDRRSISDHWTSVTRLETQLGKKK